MRLEIPISWDYDPVPEGKEYRYDAILSYTWDSSDDHPRWDWWLDGCDLIPHNEESAKFLKDNPKEEDRIRDYAEEQGWDQIRAEGLRGGRGRFSYSANYEF